MNKKDREEINERFGNVVAYSAIITFLMIMFAFIGASFEGRWENMDCVNETILIEGTYCCQFPENIGCSGGQVFFPTQSNHKQLESEGYRCRPFYQKLVDGGYLNRTEEVCKQVWVKNI